MVYFRTASRPGATACAYRDRDLALAVSRVASRSRRPHHRSRRAVIHSRLHRKSEHDADEDQRRRDSLQCTRALSASPVSRAPVPHNTAKCVSVSATLTHVDLARHDSDDRVDRVLEREQHDVCELHGEVQRAALDDRRHRAVRDRTRGAEPALRTGGGGTAREPPDARDDECRRHHVRAEGQRVPREREREHRLGRCGRRRVERDYVVHDLHDACWSARMWVVGLWVVGVVGGRRSAWCREEVGEWPEGACGAMGWGLDRLETHQNLRQRTAMVARLSSSSFPTAPSNDRLGCSLREDRKARGKCQLQLVVLSRLRIRPRPSPPAHRHCESVLS